MQRNFNKIDRFYNILNTLMGGNFLNSNYNNVIMGAMAYQIRRSSKKTPKLRVTGLCEVNSPVTGEFPSQRPVTRKRFPFDDVSWFQESISCVILYVSFVVCSDLCHFPSGIIARKSNSDTCSISFPFILIRKCGFLFFGVVLNIIHFVLSFNVSFFS